MTPLEYMIATRSTAKYPKKSTFEYLGLGIASEAGEVAGKLKKVIRDRDGQIGPAERKAIFDEVGDVLWYCARLVDELNGNLGRVMEANIEKLADRAQRDVIGGSGDNR